MKNNDWRIVITPGDEELQVSFSANSEEAAIDAREAFVELSVSGIPEDLKEQATVTYNGVTMSMDSFLILVGTEKLHEELRKGGFNGEAEKIRQEVELGVQGAKAALSDPEVQEYLQAHPDEARQIERLLNGEGR